MFLYAPFATKSKGGDAAKRQLHEKLKRFEMNLRRDVDFEASATLL